MPHRCTQAVLVIVASLGLALGSAGPKPARAEEAVTGAPPPAPPPEVAEHPARITFERDVVYGEVGERTLELDLARPASRTIPAPAILLFHGGGWSAGRRQQHTQQIRELAERGWVAATVSYRLAPLNPWPAQIEDAKCAVRWMRANAKRLRVDPERVAVMGFSAGAHLALLLATLDAKDGFEGAGGHAATPSHVSAAVAFFPPTDMVALTSSGGGRLGNRLGAKALERLLGKTYAADPGAMSPIRYLDRDDPPMLLFQGTRDPLVPMSQALGFLERASEVRARVEVVLYSGAKHGWREPWQRASRDRVESFLQANVAEAKAR